MKLKSASRRKFLGYFSAVGLSSTLLPGVLWARLQNGNNRRVTADMIREAAAISGLEFTAEEREQLSTGLNQTLDRYGDLRKIHIDDSIAPPMYFSPIVPGTKIDRVAKPFKPSKPPTARRPSRLEDLAFAPLVQLAALVKAKQVKSVELTEMYLGRLKKHNPTLNCVVTLTEELGMKQAEQADREIADGRYRGPLHGIPWGAKDIIAVPGYPTTWGSDAFKDQRIEREATVVRLLREAGAVLVAKLTTGELAGGDRWFGGRTNNPWDPTEGSSGSSAGPASATVAGLVAFAVGTETSGSILSPAAQCGATGLRPTFGRVSRHGVMTLSWTQDRIGPLCRTVEDCAFVFHAIARPDAEDLSVIDAPFNWDAQLDIRKLRVGVLQDAFNEADRHADWKKNDQGALDQLRRMGVDLVPFSLPEIPINAVNSIFGAESGASFDEFLRSGRDKNLTNKTRGNGFRQSRFIPAVEYLQAQRVRAMIMRQFANAVSGFDVYVAPYMNVRAFGGPPPAAGAAPATPPPPPPTPPPPSPIRDHFQVANLCGYPAVSVPNGFTSDGKPTSITFLGRLYAEAELLALAKAYQDAAGWHTKHPKL